MHIGSEPRQVWCWDIYGSDHSDHAVHLVRRTALAEGIAVLASKPVLHGGHAQLAGGTALVFPASGQ